MKYAEETPFKVNTEDVLIRLLEYMQDRADADHDGENYVPNEEMKLSVDIAQLLHQLEKANQL